MTGFPVRENWRMFYFWLVKTNQPAQLRFDQFNQGEVSVELNTKEYSKTILFRTSLGIIL